MEAETSEAPEIPLTTETSDEVVANEEQQHVETMISDSSNNNNNGVDTENTNVEENKDTNNDNDDGSKNEGVKEIEPPEEQHKEEETAVAEAALDDTTTTTTAAAASIEEENTEEANKAETEVETNTLESDETTNAPPAEASAATTAGAHVIDEETLKRKQILIIQSLWRKGKAKKHHKNIIKRYHVTKEIYQTEKAYVDCLEFVVKHYMMPLKEKIGSVLNQKQYDALFLDVDQILARNKSFLNVLEKRVENWHYETLIGDIFLEMSMTFALYTAFVNNFDNAMVTLRKLEQTPSFVSFAQEVENATPKNRLRMADFLIMPVQRVPRYMLLLTQLLNFTNPGHPDYDNLKNGSAEVKRIADYINEKKKEADGRVKVAEIQTKIGGDCPNLSTEDRRYIREADVVAIIDNVRIMRRLVLFNNALLCLVKTSPDKHGNKPKFEYDFEWITPLVDVQLHPYEEPVYGNNYIDPEILLKKVQQLEKQLDIEKEIEKSASKIAKIYKAEHSNQNKSMAKKEAGQTESKIEVLTNELRTQRELIRLHEPLVGLRLVTPKKLAFTIVVRSQNQRDEWIRELSQYITQSESKDASKKALKEEDSSMFPSLSSLKKDFTNFVTEGISKSVGMIYSMVSSEPIEVTNRRKLLRGTSQKNSGSPAAPSRQKTVVSLNDSDQFGSNSSLSSSNGTLRKNRSTVFGSDTHNFQTRSFKKPTRCDQCGDMIWGLGREGMKCPDCSLRVHRKCVDLVVTLCSKSPDLLTDALDETEFYEESDSVIDSS